MSRVTLVTGAGQGIGREISLAFAARGDSLVLAARNEANLTRTAADAGEYGVETLVVPTDVTDAGAVDAMATALLDRFGRVDVVVINSGVAGPSGQLWDLDLADWEQTFAVNVTGVFLVCRALFPHMVERGSGSVIIIGSISGKRPLWGRTPYTTSKAALIGLTRTLALEAGSHGIRVNLISPGFVAGPRIDWVIQAQAEGRGITAAQVRAEFEAESPLNRLTEASDIADACVFLASDQAAAITGADINVNSGAVMYG
ncbi:MAG: SDR family NAD(P)-dependent oxidoreductase [Actinomycetota bacterium]|nr:SDR family NAD(P)-dependent oxidoreductase [Actinomycetota bacterium]